MVVNEKISLALFQKFAARYLNFYPRRSADKIVKDVKQKSVKSMGFFDGPFYVYGSGRYKGNNK